MLVRVGEGRRRGTCTLSPLTTTTLGVNTCFVPPQTSSKPCPTSSPPPPPPSPPPPPPPSPPHPHLALRSFILSWKVGPGGGTSDGHCTSRHPGSSVAWEGGAAAPACTCTAVGGRAECGNSTPHDTTQGVTRPDTARRITARQCTSRATWGHSGMRWSEVE